MRISEDIHKRKILRIVDRQVPEQKLHGFVIQTLSRSLLHYLWHSDQPTPSSRKQIHCLPIIGTAHVAKHDYSAAIHYVGFV